MLLGSDPAAAREQACEIIQLSPQVVDAHRLFAEACRRMGDHDAADPAECKAIDYALAGADLKPVIDHLALGRLREAEFGVRAYAKRRPFDRAADLVLAQLAIRSGLPEQADPLIERVLEVAPSHLGANQTRAAILAQLYRLDECIQLLDRLLERVPDNLEIIGQLTTILGQIGDYGRAIEITENALQRYPDDTSLSLSLGHLMKTVGRTAECAALYRSVLSRTPACGEAWWSLANIKTRAFTPDDINAIELALNRPNVSSADRVHLLFAMGKAFDDQGLAADAMHHFSIANALKSEIEPYDPKLTANEVDGSIAALSPDRVSKHASIGCDDASPIFILGMPRAGSTLIEQILSSHSKIEGTSELPIVPTIIRRMIAQGWPSSATPYPELLNELPSEKLEEFGSFYIDAARHHRHSAKPLFTDKLPNNWNNIAFILLALPKARIIDARRHPLDCCLSNYQQLYARGQAFSYSLEHLGQYYADYVRLMAHIDAIAPGRVHRVIHEQLLAEPEDQIRSLLTYLGLEFEPDCLSFHTNTRAVRTASAEQVRQPLNREGSGKWKAYSAWLGPLRQALGPALEAYPSAPDR
jgi:tetratricopeptide (TPR) repeat protein